MGPPGWFVGLFVIVVVVGIGTTIYRMSMARDMARQAGLDPDTAAATTLLSQNGLDATYLAAALRDKQQHAPLSRPRSAQERLKELDDLRDQGLITPTEYDEHRRSILAEL